MRIASVARRLFALAAVLVAAIACGHHHSEECKTIGTTSLTVKNKTGPAAQLVPSTGLIAPDTVKIDANQVELLLEVIYTDGDPDKVYTLEVRNAVEAMQYVHLCNRHRPYTDQTSAALGVTLREGSVIEIPTAFRGQTDFRHPDLYGTAYAFNSNGIGVIPAQAVKIVKR